MVIGLLFAGAALASKVQHASASDAIQHDLQTVGFAVASMLALFTAMLEFSRVVRNILWCVVFSDLLILCLCAVDLAMRQPR